MLHTKPQNPFLQQPFRSVLSHGWPERPESHRFSPAVRRETPHTRHSAQNSLSDSSDALVTVLYSIRQPCTRSIGCCQPSRAVRVVRLDGAIVENETLDSTRVYFISYILIICVSTLLLSLDGFDFTTNLAAEIACFNNIGPGIGLVGPTGNYSAYSAFSKMLLSVNMLLGRLEIYPILIVFSRSAWRK